MRRRSGPSGTDRRPSPAVYASTRAAGVTVDGDAAPHPHDRRRNAPGAVRHLDRLPRPTARDRQNAQHPRLSLEFRPPIGALPTPAARSTTTPRASRELRLPLARLDRELRLRKDLRDTAPELRVARVITPVPELLSPWSWRHTLLTSTPLDEHYTLDDGTWRRVLGFQRATVAQDFVHIDYASGDGTTIRFGDGEFGKTPADGLRFRVDYRTGPGAASNVAAGTIRHLIHPTTDASDLSLDERNKIESIENALPVADGVDPEPLELIKQLAPEEFRAVTHRAVTPEDYCAIAERLSWVQKAGVRQRWTGSWPTTFVTPDPEDAYSVTAAQRAELAGLLDCVRQAGREVCVLDPRYRAIDLELWICVKPGHLPSDVRDRVLRRLRGNGVTPGYFNADAFTFGTPIHRLTLEGVVGAVPGVLAVKDIQIGARAIHKPRKMEPLYRVPDSEIIRLANDPRTPERGSVRVYTEGGV